MDQQDSNKPNIDQSTTDLPIDSMTSNDQQPEDYLDTDTINDSLDFSSPTAKPDLSEPFSWQAMDGVEYSRGINGYIIFGLVLIILMVLAIFVFKSITFAILLPIMAVATITLVKHGTNLINYSVSPKGIYVGDTLYDYSQFRAFGVIQGTRSQSIVLLPVKRFGISVTIYFDQQDGEKIVDLIGARLPMQDIKTDPLEKLVHWTKL